MKTVNELSLDELKEIVKESVELLNREDREVEDYFYDMEQLLISYELIK